MQLCAPETRQHLKSRRADLRGGQSSMGQEAGRWPGLRPAGKYRSGGTGTGRVGSGRWVLTWRRSELARGAANATSAFSLLQAEMPSFHERWLPGSPSFSEKSTLENRIIHMKPRSQHRAICSLQIFQRRPFGPGFCDSQSNLFSHTRNKRESLDIWLFWSYLIFTPIFHGNQQ